jgi:hypothetical protein
MMKENPCSGRWRHQRVLVVPHDDGRRRVITHTHTALHRDADRVRGSDASAPERAGCVPGAGGWGCLSGNSAEAGSSSGREVPQSKPQLGRAGRCSQQVSKTSPNLV